MGTGSKCEAQRDWLYKSRSCGVFFSHYHTPGTNGLDSLRISDTQLSTVFGLYLAGGEH